MSPVRMTQSQQVGTLIPTTVSGLFYLAQETSVSRTPWTQSAAIEPVMESTSTSSIPTVPEGTTLHKLSGEGSINGIPCITALSASKTEPDNAAIPKRMNTISYAVTKLQKSREQAAMSRKKYRTALEAISTTETSFSELAFLYSGAMRKYVCRRSMACASCRIKIAPTGPHTGELPHYKKVSFRYRYIYDVYCF